MEKIYDVTALGEMLIDFAVNGESEQVVNDMRKYTPMQQGDLRNKTQIKEPGLITVDTPYAHYQYVGELYLTADGRSWANRGEKKYPTGTELKYHTPGTGKRWFETAKENHGKQWIDLVKREGTVLYEFLYV